MGEPSHGIALAPTLHVGEQAQERVSIRKRRQKLFRMANEEALRRHDQPGEEQLQAHLLSRLEVGKES